MSASSTTRSGGRGLYISTGVIEVVVFLLTISNSSGIDDAGFGAA